MNTVQISHRQPPYLVLFLIFSVLSVVFGLYYLSTKANSKPVADQIIDQTVDTQPTITQSDSNLPTLSPSPDTQIPSYEALPTAVVQPTPAIKVYTAPDSTFSLSYPSYRSLTIENEPSGQRYVFYSRSGNITVHVGSRWSWQHPGRTFNSDFTVADQPTFQYQVSTQSLTDFQFNNLNFTIQCVHGGQATLKQECDDFISSFKLAPGGS